MLIAATAEPPRVERRTVGADTPGIAEQLYDIDNELSARFFDSLMQTEWRKDAGGYHDEVEAVHSISHVAASPIDLDALAGLADGAAVELWYGGSEVPTGTGPQPATRAG